MPWGKVDDNHYDHPKVLSIPRAIRNAADGLYWRAISRCNRTLSDGWLTDGDLDVIDSDPRLVDALVTAGLWERKPDGRLRIHDYLAHNKSKAEVVKERRQKEEAGRAGGFASGRARAKQDRKQTRTKAEAPASRVLQPNANGIEAAGVELPSRPVPTRPLPSGSIEPDALSPRPPAEPMVDRPTDDEMALCLLAEQLSGTPYGLQLHSAMGQKAVAMLRKHGPAAVEAEWRRIAAEERGMPTVRQLVLGADNALNRVSSPAPASPADRKAETAAFVARINREVEESKRGLHRAG